MQADASIFIATPIAIKATLEENIFLLSRSDINTESSRRIAYIPISPFASPSQSSPARVLQADARILTAVPISIRPKDAEMIFFLSKSVFFRNSDTSRRRAPTPARPLISSSHESFASVLHTDANFLIAIPKTIMAAAYSMSLSAPLERSFLSLPLSSIFIKPISIPAIAAMPTMPLSASSLLSAPTFFNAIDTMSIAADMASSAVVSFLVLFLLPLILVNVAIEPISSTNIMVMAPTAASSFSGLMQDRTRIEAARIPIAIAILSNTPDLSFC